METPTVQEKVEVYEALFHRLNLAIVTMHYEKIAQIVNIIDNWSYAHRMGNGQLTDEEQQEKINSVFYRMKEIANSNTSEIND